MSGSSLTLEQLYALEYVKWFGPVGRPDSVGAHGMVVKESVWAECHEWGWLESEGGEARLTGVGRAILWGVLGGESD